MTRYIDESEIKFTGAVFADSDEGIYLRLSDVQQAIEQTPTADVEEVKHGTWLPQIVGGVKSWDCSECKTIGSPHWKRCPICEAKMDGGKAE